MWFDGVAVQMRTVLKSKDSQRTFITFCAVFISVNKVHQSLTVMSDALVWLIYSHFFSLISEDLNVVREMRAVSTSILFMYTM